MLIIIPIPTEELMQNNRKFNDIIESIKAMEFIVRNELRVIFVSEKKYPLMMKQTKKATEKSIPGTRFFIPKLSNFSIYVFLFELRGLNSSKI